MFHIGILMPMCGFRKGCATTHRSMFWGRYRLILPADMIISRQLSEEPWQDPQGQIFSAMLPRQSIFACPIGMMSSKVLSHQESPPILRIWQEAVPKPFRSMMPSPKPGERWIGRQSLASVSILRWQGSVKARLQVN